MDKIDQSTGVPDGKSTIKQVEAQIEKAEALIEQAKAKTEQAKAREEQAKAQTEQAKAQAEQAKAREEQAKAQAEQAKTRAVQAESALKNVLQKDLDLNRESSPRLLKPVSGNESVEQKSPLEQLTERQREILRLIAEGQNTKQIAELLKVSPKTVEYHRMKLMAGLNLHDIPGLVRFAVKVGLITPEN